MIILITMPIRGTWLPQRREGDKLDSVRPLPLPFNVSYRSTLLSLDVDNGQATYEIEIADADVTPVLRGQIEAFARLSLQVKRARIIAAGRAMETDLLRIAR